MAGSEFAKRQLKKHGWTEGSGLGKQEHGRSDPIKVTLKMDKTGVGHDPGKEFTDHWWLRVFNEAAQKIGKNQKDNSKSKKDGQKQNKVTEIKNNLYMGFVKSSTLKNGVEEKHKHSDSSSEKSSDGENNTSLPTLNDIHKFCGGATGHKAARFGIKMGGKLARIATHEKMFEEQLKTKKQSEAVSETNSSRSNSLHDAVDQKPSLTSIESPCENGKGRRKKRKHKEKSKAECLEDSVTNSQCVNEENVDNELSQDYSKKNKKRKHKKNKHITSDDEGVVKCESDECDLFHANKGQQDSDNLRGKKRKRHHAADEETVNENSLSEIKIKRKKKKKTKV
ncbi:hypothetical protein BsWGS_04557 [Bradybaena similaris]